MPRVAISSLAIDCREICCQKNRPSAIALKTSGSTPDCIESISTKSSGNCRSPHGTPGEVGWSSTTLWSRRCLRARSLQRQGLPATPRLPRVRSGIVPRNRSVETGFQSTSGRSDRHGWVGNQGAKAECGYLAASVIQRHSRHSKIRGFSHQQTSEQSKVWMSGPRKRRRLLKVFGPGHQKQQTEAVTNGASSSLS